MALVCDFSANVSAALHESLGVNRASTASTADNKIRTSHMTCDTDAGDENNVENKLAAAAKRVLFSRIEYEEVDNYSQSVLDQFKSKYVLLKPDQTTGSNNINENGKLPSSTCINSGTNATRDVSGNALDTNGNETAARRLNPTELPKPKRILYPRENLCIGWRNSPRRWTVGAGMMNVGNTCYLNSTLQALFHVPSLANWLVSDTQHMERCGSTESGCIICAMAKTLYASQGSQGAIRPYFIYSKLKAICKHLVMGRQEDAHEFLRYLVEAMEKSYLSRFQNHKLLDQYSKETTPLNQILGGYLRTSVRCLSCGHVSVTFQHFQDLLLDIRKVDTLDEALNAYFSRERLEDMGYKCEACKKKVSATKQFSLERPPIVLCIQLKRFSILGNKLNKQIQIKQHLDLGKYTSRRGNNVHYKLVAMVSHLGATQHCGHYTAIGLTASGTYYNYDDSYVRPVSMGNICNTNAYIIFYEIDTLSHQQVLNPQVRSTEPLENNRIAETSISSCASTNSIRPIGPKLPTRIVTNGYSLLKPKQPATASNSKIIIHFKNTNNVDTKSNSNTSTTTASSTVNGGERKAQFKNNDQLLALSTLQKTSVAESSKAGTSVGESPKKGNLSPCLSDHQIHSDSKKLLPNMPNLLDDNRSSLMSTSCVHQPHKIHKKNDAPVATAKRLVPYASESSDGDECTVRSKQTNNKPASNVLKRGLNFPYSSDSSDDELSGKRSKMDTVAVATTVIGGKTNSLSPNASIADTANTNSCSQSKFKQKTDVIERIFNYNKRNANSNINHCNNNTNSPIKKQDKHTHPQVNNKRAKTEPPSPPLIKTKTGLWQVTAVQPTHDSVNPTEQKVNPKNPFARKTPERVLGNKHSKFNDTNNSPRKQAAGHSVNKYQPHDIASNSTTVNDNAVSELLRQSHRGYGAPTLAWTGEEAQIDKEIAEEKRQQRQRDWQEEEENDMDRGRQKKVKACKQSTLMDTHTPGYNPFQEQQQQQRRWKHGVHRHHYGAFRHQFQRNKFNRFQQHKFQRSQPYQRNYGGRHT